MDIGFVGLGAMGSAMARNLVKAGHAVRVWNRSGAAADGLDGATAVGSPAEAFRGDAVVSMLANDDAVRAVVLESGALDGAPASLVHVNMATISVALAEELTAAHKAKGIAYVAAPVFGRPDAAEAAKLNIMAAGDPKAIARVQPLLDAMGVKTWPMGEEPKNANVAKIAGNFLIASAIECMGEACALVKANGVAPGALMDVLSNTIFASPIYKNYGALIVDEKFLPAGFKLTLGLKDVGLALAAGEGAGAKLPVADLLRTRLQQSIEAGDGDADWTALSKVSMREAGLAN